MLEKQKLICKQRFEFEGKTYFPGEITEQIERVANRWVSRGLANYTDPNAITRNGYLKHPKVSIVILIKDALKYTKDCIESVNKYTNNFELILVDNGSREKTKAWLKHLDWLDYKLITNKTNKGFSYGNNQAIKIAKYDYICFLNSDTLVSPNWLGKMMRGFKYSKDIGIVGPSTCHCATIQSPQVFKNFRAADQKRVNQISELTKEGYTETMVVGFCFVFKKEVFGKIGVFDYKRYGIACHEDLDIVWRANKAGYKSLFCHKSYVHHFGNRSTREMGLNPREIRQKNKPVFEERIKDDKNLFVENDVEVDDVKEIKGTIPILMITWNRFEYTKKAIKAIQRFTENYQLFIWDNGSSDGTEDFLRSLKSKKIKVHFEKSNKGLIPPMNYFLNEYRNYRYIAKVDNDTIVSPGWLEKLKEVMEEFPLTAVEADHYLMLNYDIKTNDDYYRHLFSVDFKGHKLYLAEIVGGTGTLIRRSAIDFIPEMPGTLSGWIQYQHERKAISAFYTGAWIDRLDQVSTNKFKEVSDYPEYDKEIDRLRPSRLKPKKRIRDGLFKETYNKTKEWYERL